MKFGMLLFKLGYFAFSGFIFLLASFPLRFEMRNEKSFFLNLKNLLRQKKPGSLLLAIAFINLNISASLFIFFSNTN